MIRFCWSSCKWGSLLLLVGAAAGVLFFYPRLDDEVRRRVEARIAEQYPELTVSIRSARFLAGQGIEVRGLSISEPGVSGPTAELAYLEEIFLHSETDWKELLRGKLSISTIVIRRPTIRVTRRPDGSWSAARLFPLPKLSDTPPHGTIENGVVEISDPLKSQSGTFTLRDIDLEFKPDDRVGSDGRTALELTGRLSGDHFRQIDVAASFDPSGEQWSLHGAIQELDFSPELTRSLPSVVSRKLAELGSLRAQVKSRFSIQRDPAAAPPFSFEAAGQVTRGRIDDPRLPYPLTDLRAHFECNSQGLIISDATAQSGQTTLRIEEFRRHGHEPASPYTLKAEGRRLVFAPQLRSALPLAWQEEWQKFMPSGEFDVDRLEIAYDGAAWKPQATIRLLNVGFTHYKFPYRLEHCEGRVELNGDDLTVHVKTASEGAQVRVAGQFSHPGPAATGYFEVRGDGVRFDEKLFLALNEPSRRVVRSLNPRGTMNVFFRCQTEGPTPGKWRKRLDISLNRCSLRYDQFPYPLDNIRGSIHMDNGVWDFGEGGLEGVNDTGRVACRGRLIPNENGQYEVALSFNAFDVPLDEELRDALVVRSPGGARLWTAMKPRGAVNLEALVHFSPGTARSAVTVTAWPVFDEYADHSVSIEPSYFPYRLDKLRGEFTYQDGRVKFAGVRAEHRNTVVVVPEGSCEVDASGGWRLSLAHVEVDRLSADGDLVRALGNGRLKRLISELKPKGAVNLRGKFQLASRGDAADPIASNWKDLRVYATNLSLDCGVTLERISGSILLNGEFDGRKLACHGELDLDSVNYKNFQFTQLLGPFWIDDTAILFGFKADRQRGVRPERQMTARLYEGRLLGDVKIDLGEAPRYFVHAELTGADLARAAQEAFIGRQQISGRLSANADFYGAGRGLHNLGGRGSIWLNNADLYELPVMVALLKTLRGRAPDTTAFNTADMEFRIQGEHVYLRNIHCQGDAISLRGTGELNLDRTVKMTFYPIVGRDDRRLPLVDQFLGRASQQIMLIHVDGTLEAPQTRSEVFPALAQALQAVPQLQSDEPLGEPVRRIPAAGPAPRPAAAGPAPGAAYNGPARYSPPRR